MEILTYFYVNLLSLAFIGGLFLVSIFPKYKDDLFYLYPLCFDQKDWTVVIFTPFFLMVLSILCIFKFNLLFLIGVLFWTNTFIGLILFKKHYIALEERNKDNYDNCRITASQAEKPKYSLIFFWIFFVFSIYHRTNYVK